MIDNKEDFRTQKSGKELNSARVISNIFFTEQKEGVSANFDTEFSLSMMIWSQVVTHDVSGTSGKSGERNKVADFNNFGSVNHLLVKINRRKIVPSKKLMCRQVSQK